ncbi:MAG: bifunctional phosphopantothenoylcysteine decarboxylase/phosphopantothenate--cysteine ligase CoaBC [Desulfovibrionaceae bacterium]|nr:bifunctional phosphopantothenoylcysteine decarboxylase/phosphopantothenate--cysteine ligase CoaBC [Desulfovibrionaceae bacterium]
MEKHFPQAPFAGKRIHLGVCGSVAAYKALDLLRAFCKVELRVTVTMTEAATRFVTPLSFQSLGAERVYGSMFGEGRTGDPFGHLRPGLEAEAFLVAPVSATTLARLACGLADEMLAGQALAWPGSLLLAPAMNPRMWNNQATKDNIAALERRGHLVIAPETGPVACGEEGEGRFPDLRIICLYALRSLSPQDLAGQRVLITLGPTREPWDCVRFWSNHSSGLMGASLAVAAWLRGADVQALRGPVAPWLPPQIQTRETPTAQEMLRTAEELWPDMHLGIFTAAVADFAPIPFGAEKFKKTSSTKGFNLSFQPNPDILATLARSKKAGQRIIAFAAESENLEKNAHCKLQTKNADLLVANLVGGEDCAFASPNNTALILDHNGGLLRLPTLPKGDLAWRILDCLSSL